MVNRRRQRANAGTFSYSLKEKGRKLVLLFRIAEEWQTVSNLMWNALQWAPQWVSQWGLWWASRMRFTMSFARRVDITDHGNVELVITELPLLCLISTRMYALFHLFDMSPVSSKPEAVCHLHSNHFCVRLPVFCDPTRRLNWPHNRIPRTGASMTH